MASQETSLPATRSMDQGSKTNLTRRLRFSMGPDFLASNSMYRPDEVKWKVKLGAEVRSETALQDSSGPSAISLTKIILFEHWVEGMPRHRKRGQNLVQPEGLLHDIRWELKGKRLTPCSGATIHLRVPGS